MSIIFMFIGCWGIGRCGKKNIEQNNCNNFAFEIYAFMGGKLL